MILYETDASCSSAQGPVSFDSDGMRMGPSQMWQSFGGRYLSAVLSCYLYSSVVLVRFLFYFLPCINIFINSK